MRQAQSRNALLDEVMPPLASGVAGAEIALFPHQYNLRNAPEGSPERQAAEEALGSVNSLLMTAGRGFVPAALGGFTGAHLAPVPRLSPPVAETEALLRNISRARRAERVAQDGPNMGRGLGASPPSGGGAPPTRSDTRPSSGTARDRQPSAEEIANQVSSAKPIRSVGVDGRVRWHDPNTGNFVSPPKRRE